MVIGDMTARKEFQDKQNIICYLSAVTLTKLTYMFKQVDDLNNYFISTTHINKEQLAFG